MSMVDLDDVALYSALYGRYEWPKPLPADLGCRAILYTDEPEIGDMARGMGWQVRVEPAPITDRAVRNAQEWDPSSTPGMLRHKWWKTHPKVAVPDAKVSLWVDASLLIKADRYAARCLEALGDDDWCAVRHPYRDCIYTEAAFSATLARYDANALVRQVRAYELLGHPRQWGLFATGANVRRHTTATVKIGAYWWWECTTRTHQDQVSLPMLFRMASTLLAERPWPFTWNTNMPWDVWWGVYEHGRPEGVNPWPDSPDPATVSPSS